MNSTNNTFILNVAFSISSSSCLLILTLNSLILLERLLALIYFKSLHISGAFLTLRVFELTLLILGFHYSFNQCYKLRFSFWFFCYPLLCCYILYWHSISPCFSFSDSFGILLFCWSVFVFYYLRIASYSWESYPVICSQTLRQLNFFTINLFCFKIRPMQEDLMPANTFFKSSSYRTKWVNIADIVAKQETILCFDSLYHGCL